MSELPAAESEVPTSAVGQTNLSGARKPEPRLVTIMGVMGNVLEWYDFALFGFFSDIIAQVFFPPEDPDDENSNLIKSFVIFGGAFLMRPIGGLVIGYVGDKHGRKKALTRSLFIMALPTTAMGLLPTYASAGPVAIFLLVLCRLLQGISVGGQLPASLVYTLEKRDPAHWGYYGALPMTAANIGTLLGNLCGATLRQVLTEDQLLEFGWRIPFLSGILIAGVACYLRVHGADVHTNAEVYDSENSKLKNPIREAFRKGNRLSLFSTSMAPMLWAAGFYTTFVWMAIFMEELLDPPVKNAFWVNASSLFFGMTFMLPLAGHLSDRFGRVRTMSIAAVGLLISGPIMVVIIGKASSFVAFLAQLLLGVLLSFFGAPLCAWLVETFPEKIRLTSASIGYDIAHALAAGFSPALATALFTNVGTYAPGLIYIIFASLSLIGILSQHFCGTSNNTEPPGSSDLELSAAEVSDNAAPVESNLPSIS